MKSAYVTLGIPANASTGEIEEAFRRAAAHYTPERLANSDDGAARLEEVKIAYEVLRRPDMRAAHDRKLAAAKRPSTVYVEVERSGLSHGAKIFWSAAALVLMMFAAGGYLSGRNEQHRRAVAQEQKVAAEKEAREARERQEAEDRAAAERRQAAARAEAAERNLRLTSQTISAYQSMADQRAEQYAAQQRRQEELSREVVRATAERRQQIEAQQRVEADKRRIRELCLQNYGKLSC